MSRSGKRLHYRLPNVKTGNMPACRAGMSARAEAGTHLSDNLAAVTCKRCLSFVRNAPTRKGKRK